MTDVWCVMGVGQVGRGGARGGGGGDNWCVTNKYLVCDEWIIQPLYNQPVYKEVIN